MTYEQVSNVTIFPFIFEFSKQLTSLVQISKLNMKYLHFKVSWTLNVAPSQTFKSFFLGLKTP